MKLRFWKRTTATELRNREAELKSWQAMLENREHKVALILERSERDTNNANQYARDTHQHIKRLTGTIQQLIHAAEPFTPRPNNFGQVHATDDQMPLWTAVRQARTLLDNAPTPPAKDE